MERLSGPKSALILVVKSHINFLNHTQQGRAKTFASDSYQCFLLSAQHFISAAGKRLKVQKMPQSGSGNTSACCKLISPPDVCWRCWEQDTTAVLLLSLLKMSCLESKKANFGIKLPPSINWYHSVLLLSLEGLTWRKRTCFKNSVILILKEMDLTQPPTNPENCHVKQAQLGTGMVGRAQL